MPVARLHFQWNGNNALRMPRATRSRPARSSCTRRVPCTEGAGRHPNSRAGACATPAPCNRRMRATTRSISSLIASFGQTHDVKNLYVCDASVFPSSTDKTTTVSILAFTLPHLRALCSTTQERRTSSRA